MHLPDEPEVLQALHLPRGTSRRCSKCCTCHEKRSGAQSINHFRSGLPRTFLKVLQVLHFPRKTRLRCSKCCACHSKRAGGAPSAAPATQKRSGAQCNQSSPDFRGSMKMLQVLHLPRACRCSKCCTCHESAGAPSAAPATQNNLEVLQVLVPRKTKRHPK